jgi:hypothetical protein
VALIAGCSVIKKANTSEYKVEKESQTNNILEDTENQNITTQSFFIQKAEIEFSSEGENQKLIASIKFVYPDKYLLSLRSKAGIEAGRIFVTADTVLINDRINKKLYFGKPYSLEHRYGISATLLPLVFGDFLRGKQREDSKNSCTDGRVDLNYVINGRKIIYEIDCNKKKVVLTKQEGFVKSSLDQIEFSAFIKEANVLMPSEIRIYFEKSTVKIRILKIEVPWDGNIEFIPGNRYDLIELL